jgi:hypothetical protein
MRKLKQTTLSELRAQTKLSHTTTYRTVQHLIERGLVEQVPLNRKQSLYLPRSLSVLATSLRSETSRLRRVERTLCTYDRLVPYMDLDDPPSSATSVEVREGMDAFHEEYLKLPELGHDEFLAIGSSDRFWQASRASIDAPLERAFVSRRLRKGVYSRSLMLASRNAEAIARNDTRELRTTKIQSTLPVMTNMLMLCGDQVSHFVCDVDHPQVIILRDPELVAMHRASFETLWRG